jgi:arsenate reductase
MLRAKEPLFAALNLAGASDDALLDAAAAHPILLNRPIVVTAKGAKLCRPPELVHDIL